MRRLSKLLSVYTTCLQCCSFKKGLSFRYHMRLSFEKRVPVDPAQPTNAQRVICWTSRGSISPVCKVFLLQRKGTVFAGRPGVRCGKKEKVTSCLVPHLLSRSLYKARPWKITVIHVPCHLKAFYIAHAECCIL